MSNNTGHYLLVARDRNDKGEKMYWTGRIFALFTAIISHAYVYRSRTRALDAARSLKALLDNSRGLRGIEIDVENLAGEKQM